MELGIINGSPCIVHLELRISSMPFPMAFLFMFPFGFFSFYLRSKEATGFKNSWQGFLL